MHEADQHERYNYDCPICLDVYAADVLRKVYDVLSLTKGSPLQGEFIRGIEHARGR